MTNFSLTDISKMFYLDIECVREYKTFTEFIEFRTLANWKRVAAKYYADALKDSEEIPSDADMYLSKAALHPEYGKIVSIAFGFLTFDENKNPVKKLYSIGSADELEILEKIQKQFIGAFERNQNMILCGHNVLEYDIPFIVKRMIKHGLKIPQILLNIINAKPWEATVLDTMKFWKMGTSKIVSLDTIAEFLNIPSSKQGVVSGANLGEYFWNGTDDDVTKINNINAYCRADVSVVMDITEKLSKV